MSYILNEEERAITEMGRSMGFYVSKEVKQYVQPGDKFRVSIRLVNGEMEIVAKRRIFKFDLDDIRKFIQKTTLKLEYDDDFDGTRILRAKNDKISLKSMQSKFEEPRGVIHLIVNSHLVHLSPQNYKESRKWIGTSKDKINISFEPEGDIDTIKLVEHPEYYGLSDESDLFNRLEKLDKKIDASITVRLDNRTNDLKEVESSIDLLNDLNSKLQVK